MKKSRLQYFILITNIILFIGLSIDRLFSLQNVDLISKTTAQCEFFIHIFILYATVDIMRKCNTENKLVFVWCLLINTGLLLNDASWYFLSYFNLNTIHVQLSNFLMDLVPFFVWIIASILFISNLLLDARKIEIIDKKIVVLLVMINVIMILLFFRSLSDYANIFTVDNISKISTFIAQTIVFDYCILCLIRSRNTGLSIFLSGIITLIIGDFFLVYAMIAQTNKLFTYGELSWYLGLILNYYGLLKIEYIGDYEIKNWVCSNDSIKARLVFWIFAASIIGFLLFFVFAYYFSLIPTSILLTLPLYIAVYSLILISLSLIISTFFEKPFIQLEEIIDNLGKNSNFQNYNSFKIKEFANLHDFICKAFRDKTKKDLGEMTAAMVHDIKSPLSSISMIAKCGHLQQEERVSLELAVQRIDDIVTSTLTKYKETTEKFDLKLPRNTIHSSQKYHILPTIVGTTIDSILAEKRLQDEFKDIQFVYTCGSIEYFSCIEISHSDFARNISNIINNAAQAMDNTGIIEIVLSIDNNQICITIKDNGCGINEELLNKLRNCTIVTTKSDGHGIGLSQFSSLIQNHGGSVTINSVLGNGTEIVAKLPLLDTQKWLAREIVIHNDDVVIIVDDDKSIHNAWQKLLQHKCHNIITSIRIYTFLDATTALDFIEKIHNKDSIILLVDYELYGQKFNGLDLLAKAHISRSILVTNYYAKPDVFRSCLDLQVALLPKCSINHLSIIYEN